jgi:hypothetical protein
MTLPYRLEFNEKGQERRDAPCQQDVPARKQVQFGGDMTLDQLETVVGQLTRYGMIGCVDVPRLRAIAPLVFNVDKPVPREIMERVRDISSAIKIEQGRLRRQKAAISVNEMVQRVVNQQFVDAGFPEVATDQIDVGIEQLEQSEAGERTIAEGFHLRPGSDGRPGAPSKRPGGKRKK